MRHLFLAPLVSAYGETLHGIRIAHGVVAAGHNVVFLAPAAMHPLIGDAPITFGRIDLALPHLDREVAEVIRRMRCDTLVLVDAAAVGKTARALRLDPRAFTHPGVPVIALDCWNLPAQPVPWDYGAHSEVIAAEFHQLERRIVAVPLAPPDVANGFCALPVLAPIDRARVRRELGIPDEDRLIVWPTASWQHAESHSDATLARRAAELPALVLSPLASLGPRVHVVHVGPRPFADTPRQYRHLAQVPPAEFEQLVGAADLLISNNVVATSLATAIAAGTPIVLAVGSAIHAWPLSLAALLAPTLADNPLLTALRRVELTDEAAYAGACRELLFDAEAAAALRSRQLDYARRVRALPAGHERLLELALIE